MDNATYTRLAFYWVRTLAAKEGIDAGRPPKELIDDYYAKNVSVYVLAKDWVNYVLAH